ncbi:MAG TPA: MFS transporter [Gaiellaceae bacterium]|nr:MFS transporter [Gaiellaceae bacterium]
MRNADARRLFYGLSFGRALGVGWVIFDLYLVRVLQFSPLQLILMGTAMEATIFVTEVPTGILADTFSRRLSVILGFLGMGAAIVGVGVSSQAWLVIALWGCWGLAYTFQSGAYEAWITDEIGVENVGSLFLRGQRVASVGSLLGLAGGVAIGYFSLRAAVISTGCVELLAGLACILLMPETGFVRGERSRSAFWATARSGVRFMRGSTILVILAITELIAGFGAEAFDRLTEAHVIRDVGFPAAINPVFGFGVVSAVAMVFGFFAVTPLIRRVDEEGVGVVARLLAVCTVLTIVAQILFAVGTGFWFVMAVFLGAVLSRSLLGPLYTTWLNDLVTDSSVRATVLSISGQANAIGQAAGGPVLGVVGNVFGIPYALVAGALSTLPAAALYARAGRRHGEMPLVAAVEPAQP